MGMNLCLLPDAQLSAANSNMCLFHHSFFLVEQKLIFGASLISRICKMRKKHVKSGLTMPYDPLEAPQKIICFPDEHFHRPIRFGGRGLDSNGALAGRIYTSANGIMYLLESTWLYYFAVAPSFRGKRWISCCP